MESLGKIWTMKYQWAIAHIAYILVILNEYE